MRGQRYCIPLVTGTVLVLWLRCYLATSGPSPIAVEVSSPSTVARSGPVATSNDSRPAPTKRSPPLGVIQQVATTTKAPSDCPPCNVHDLQTDVQDDTIKCVPLNSRPKTTICVYPAEKDVYISKGILMSGQWEGGEVAKVLNYLTSHPGMGVIDIGCNIGVYTLPAAQMGRKVVAVEPNQAHVVRVHKAARLSQLESRITLLNNAVSNVRGKALIKMHHNNQGAIEVQQVDDGASDSSLTVKTITMDDLLAFCDFHQAILKIDIEGSEHRAFASAEGLFANVHIPVILMEWAAMVPHNAKPEADPDRQMVVKMIEFFQKRNFEAKSWEGKVLLVSQWGQWPRDIVWIQKETFLS